MYLSELLNENEYDAASAFWRELKPFVRADMRTDYVPEFSAWPPPEAEQRRAERRLLQDPEWVSYWARFGWTSWSYAPSEQWRFDRDRRHFTFRDVPFLAKANDGSNRVRPWRGRLDIDLQGNVLDDDRQPYDDFYVPILAAVDQCRDVVRSRSRAIRANLPFMTGRYFVRFGLWPKNEISQNFLASRYTGEPVFEEGVSAYDATFDIQDCRWILNTVDEAATNGTMQRLFYSDRPIFLVQGRELARTGSDGEPLLRDVTLVKRMKKTEVYVPGMYDHLDDT